MASALNLRNPQSQFVEELEGSEALRWLALGFICLHILTVNWWRHDLFQILVESAESICWPIWPGCQNLRPLSEQTVFIWIGSYVLIDLLAIWAWTKRRWSHLWVLLIALELLKLTIFVQDYRFMGNYHYMMFWVSFAFLFLPEKASVIPALLVLFYLAAGALKLNREWISGAALGVLPPWPAALTVPMQSWAAFVELAIAPLIFSRSYYLFWFALFNLIAFHVVSFFVVGHFYPLVCLIWIAFLSRLAFQSFPVHRPTKRTSAVFLLIFILAQLPYHLLSKDGAITGKGRTLALNMFDADSHCQTFGFVRTNEHTFLEVGYDSNALPPRIRCDRIVVRSLVKNICAQARTGVLDIDSFYLTSFARRTTFSEWHRIFDHRSTCNPHKRVQR